MRADHGTNRTLRGLLGRLGRTPLGAAALVLAAVLGLLWQGVQHPAQARQCAVVHVHDGDTLTVRCGIEADQSRRLKVRVWGIDAPEIEQRPWGARARDRLRELASGNVNIERLDRDDYGRTVARVYRNGEDLGLALVREGYATVYRRYNEDPEYYDAMREARDRHLGIWARPGLQQTPRVWREEHPNR